MERSGIFPPEVCAQVRCGERTGRLEETLSAMAESGESRLRLARQLRSALLYPSILFLLMLLVIGVLLIRVLPVFEEVYASLGGGMTGLAGGLLRLGEWLSAALPWLAPILAVLAALGLAFAGSQRFRETVLRRWRGGRWGDRGVSRKLQDARIAQSLSLGMRSGLSGQEALPWRAPQCAPAAGERCHRAEKLLEEGLGFAEALRQGEALPPAACTLLALGIRQRQRRHGDPGDRPPPDGGGGECPPGESGAGGAGSGAGGFGPGGDHPAGGDAAAAAGDVRPGLRDRL